jgi:hypothetical protein
LYFDPMLSQAQPRDRHEDRPTLDVRDEYDVQDLTHALLRIHFDDVRPEEWVPSYTGSGSRTDFLLPQIDTVVEIKKTRQGLNAKSVGEQLIIDIVKYKNHPKCRRLLCFVYDPQGRIANPIGIENDLNSGDHGIDVRVYILPRTGPSRTGGVLICASPPLSAIKPARISTRMSCSSSVSASAPGDCAAPRAHV